MLSEQAIRGRTVIETVKAENGIGFIIVLRTPNVIGCEAGCTPESRARQDVLIEIWYFIDLSAEQPSVH